MRKLFWLSLLPIIASACVSVPNTKACSVAGKLAAGMICAETISGKTSEMTLDETIVFLEPTDKRAGAICKSADDSNKEKTALEKACRELGNRCTYETRAKLGVEQLPPEPSQGT